MALKKALTDAQLRQKLIDTRCALLHQVEEISTNLADLAVKSIRYSRDKTFTVGGKGNALTAMTTELQVRYALIEFIDSLHLETIGRNEKIRDKLVRRHVGTTRNLMRSMAETSTRMGRMTQTCMQARDEGKLLPFGDAATRGVTGEHARLLKDLAVLRFLTQLGISSKTASRHDL